MIFCELCGIHLDRYSSGPHRCGLCGDIYGSDQFPCREGEAVIGGKVITLTPLQISRIGLF